GHNRLRLITVYINTLITRHYLGSLTLCEVFLFKGAPIMAEPTTEELQQQIIDLQKLITAEYPPPSGPEYSFPKANQGITQEQFRLMFLGQANGMIHGDNGVVNDPGSSTGYRYYLEGHDSDSETNQRNTLILRAGTSAESIVEGFYHRLTEDMELPFPSVTSTTVYHVCITYDPRLFK